MIKVIPAQEDRIPYWLYLPEDGRRKDRKLPVVVFLHGMGEDEITQVLMNAFNSV